MPPEPPPSHPPKPFNIHTSLLFDPKTKSYLKNHSITISPTTGLITRVWPRATENWTHQTCPPDLDLRRYPLLLPGLVDAHTHIFLHPYAHTPAQTQLRDESPTARTIRAVTHVRNALLAGYTTYRDLGTEGLADSDIGVRDAINRGIIPGPRIFAATQAIASTGGYEIHSENASATMPVMADTADGVEGVRTAVRRRLGVGADVVKVYVDYRRRAMRFPPPLRANGEDIAFPPCGAADGILGRDRNPSLVMWSPEELDALVAEATRANCPVAAHCGSNAAVVMAARAGVTSIEHGPSCDRETLEAVKEAGCIFVPTLAAMELFIHGETFENVLATTWMAWEMGVKLACGGDTGTFAHGENARELELMMRAGVPVEDVLVAATVGGWEACGGERCGRRFGWLEEGCAADFVGLDADLREDGGALRKVGFVMKDGRVWKERGEAVGMI
ncbi:hypothetical protein MMC30_008937 [Trapelia coarctata]|nr:hypothetical protein [Trapelia coarctata]